MNRTGEASAAATLSNLGPGFDVLGLALAHPRETVRVTLREAPGTVVQGVGPFGDRLPRDPERNVAVYAARRVVAAVQGGSGSAGGGVSAGAFAGVLTGASTGGGLEVVIEKAVPPGSGLGSSAASSVAAAVATARALGASLAPEILLGIARDAEGLAAGSPHLDNVAPALVGGCVAVVSTEPPRVRRLPFPPAWRFAIVLPDLEVRTADARAVLPASIPREDAITNLRHLAGLLDAIARADLEAFAHHLVDRIAVPYRLPLWPYLDDARAAAKGAGALALEVSGSGPTVYAPCPDEGTAARVAAAVVDALAARKLGATSYVTGVSAAGALDLPTRT